MKAFTTDEVRRRVGELRKVFSREPQALLLESGEPIALLVPVNRATLDETASAIRQARAHLTLRSNRERSRKSGRSRITIAEIDRVISAARKS